MRKMTVCPFTWTQCSRPPKAVLLAVCGGDILLELEAYWCLKLNVDR